MAFSEDTKLQAWNRAGGKCECTRMRHIPLHIGNCKKKLDLALNNREGEGAWEAHHKISVEAGGSDDLSNCEILCWECHKRTL